jgi:hypothetical protein
MNLGACHEQLGHTATAWAMYLKAASTAKRTDDARGKNAKKKASEIEDKLVYLTIDVPPEAELDDLVIKRNKVVIDRGLWNTKIPVDPDDYTISARAKGYKTWSDTVTIKTKNKVVEIAPLEKRAETEEEEPEQEPPHREPVVVVGHGRRYQTEAITLAVIGGGGLVLGTGFGIYGRSVQSQAETLCPNPKCGDAYAVQLNKSARVDALVANISWGIGGAALIAAGIVWYVGAPTASSTVSVVPVVGGDRAGLAVGGQF